MQREPGRRGPGGSAARAPSRPRPGATCGRVVVEADRLAEEVAPGGEVGLVDAEEGGGVGAGVARRKVRGQDLGWRQLGEHRLVALGWGWRPGSASARAKQARTPWWQLPDLLVGGDALDDEEPLGAEPLHLLGRRRYPNVDGGGDPMLILPLLGLL